MRAAASLAAGRRGVMLGYLLARAGVDVIVLEMWPDFFRDFRGDTIHPSTMQVLYELGLLEEFLKLPHSEMQQMAAHMGGVEVTVADFARLDARNAPSSPSSRNGIFSTSSHRKRRNSRASTS